ncbi:MAG TPA: ShlB/FhaC/HecB family hemolysin secretion/activation protein, partial [Paracoccus sp. (in: a-proteobacteria)]|nr:ShlB/FhaC/HecB family hemolysin secretion/activation protein [Paracoccus sp. (in: a-proteobacteria)]
MAITALLCGAALAQTASQVTKPSYQPPLQRMTGSLVFSGAPGLAAPEGADRLSVQLSGVSVDGALPGGEAAVDRMRQRLTGKRVPVSEIFTAASDLEAAYV